MRYVKAVLSKNAKTIWLLEMHAYGKRDLFKELYHQVGGVTLPPRWVRCKKRGWLNNPFIWIILDEYDTLEDLEEFVHTEMFLEAL